MFLLGLLPTSCEAVCYPAPSKSGIFFRSVERRIMFSAGLNMAGGVSQFMTLGILCLGSLRRGLVRAIWNAISSFNIKKGCWVVTLGAVW